MYKEQIYAYVNIKFESKYSYPLYRSCDCSLNINNNGLVDLPDVILNRPCWRLFIYITIENM